MGGSDAGIFANSDLKVTNAGTVQSQDEHAIETNDRANITDTGTGTIRGTGGTALNLGMGADSLLLGAGSVMDGITLLGDDGELLSFYDLGYSDGYASPFDGGDGTDEVSFAFSDSLLASVSWLDDVLILGFGGDAGSFDIALSNFETYSFDDGNTSVSYSTVDLIAQAAAVPLPAAFRLMGLGLGGLALTRRRKT